MAIPNSKTLIVIIGPTGVGKTDTAISIANHYAANIISCDSRQMYDGLIIGTAAPTPEELRRAPHHFIGHLQITDSYNASQYEHDALQKLDELYKHNHVVVMTGGSMLYVDAICKGIDIMPDVDPALRAELMKRLEAEGIEALRAELKQLDPNYYLEVDLKNPIRIVHALEICHTTGKPFSSFRKKEPKKRPFNIIKIGLNRDRAELFDRINKRVLIMIEQGLEAEAKHFYPFKNYQSLNTVGYKQLFDYFEGQCSRDKAIELIQRDSRRYAKKQLTWFKKQEDITWFNPADQTEIITHIEKKLAI